MLFPSLRIRKERPAGGTTVVKFTPTEGGELVSLRDGTFRGRLAVELVDLWINDVHGKAMLNFLPLFTFPSAFRRSKSFSDSGSQVDKLSIMG